MAEHHSNHAWHNELLLPMEFQAVYYKLYVAEAMFIVRLIKRTNNKIKRSGHAYLVILLMLHYIFY